MYIPKDNDMLYSMVNMKLRDQYDSLEDLCECEDLDPASLLVRLNHAGYEYDEEHNKFTPILDVGGSGAGSGESECSECSENSENSEHSESSEHSENT